MAEFRRFAREPSSREPSIWDVYKGVYPARTAWSAPTYEYWWPYPFPGPYRGISPTETLTNPEEARGGGGVTGATPTMEGTQGTTGGLTALMGETPRGAPVAPVLAALGGGVLTPLAMESVKALLSRGPQETATLGPGVRAAAGQEGVPGVATVPPITGTAQLGGGGTVVPEGMAGPASGQVGAWSDTVAPAVPGAAPLGAGPAFERELFQGFEGASAIPAPGASAIDMAMTPETLPAATGGVVEALGGPGTLAGAGAAASLLSRSDLGAKRGTTQTAVNTALDLAILASAITGNYELIPFLAAGRAGSGMFQFGGDPKAERKMQEAKEQAFWGAQSGPLLEATHQAQTPEDLVHNVMQASNPYAGLTVYSQTGPGSWQPYTTMPSELAEGKAPLTADVLTSKNPFAIYAYRSGNAPAAVQQELEGFGNALSRMGYQSLDAVPPDYIAPGFGAALAQRGGGQPFPAYVAPGGSAWTRPRPVLSPEEVADLQSQYESFLREQGNFGDPSQATWPFRQWLEREHPGAALATSA